MWRLDRPAVGIETASDSHVFHTAMTSHQNLVDNETMARVNASHGFDAIASQINLYYTPMLVFFGVWGNLLSVFVFYTSKLRLQSTSQYLTALAISDTVFLLQLLLPWLNAMDLAPLFHKQGWCQVFVYTSYVSSCLSAWLVMAFTVERFVAVLYPLRRNTLCTVTRARIVIGTLTVAAFLLNVPVLRFATPNRRDCNIDMNYLDHAARFNMIDTGFSFSLPLAVIVILNSWIVISVCRLERARLLMGRQSRGLRTMARHRFRLGRQGLPPPPTASSPLPLPARALPRPSPRSQQRVTRMLLLVSSVFVMLNVPAYTMRILAYAYDIDKEDFGVSWDGLQQVALMFFNTNFGINFLLYCLSGQNFRRLLMQALPWRRANARQEAIRRDCFPAAQASSVSASAVVSICTEDSSNYCTADAGSTPDTRRRRHVEYISRWTFDNSRQRGENGQRETGQRGEHLSVESIRLAEMQRGS